MTKKSNHGVSIPGLAKKIKVKVPSITFIGFSFPKVNPLLPFLVIERVQSKFCQTVKGNGCCTIGEFDGKIIRCASARTHAPLTNQIPSHPIA